MDRPTALERAARSLPSTGRSDRARRDLEVAPSWFHRGQLEAWASEAEEVAICSGKQAGKTSFGPAWMLREMQRMGPGEYGAGAPTFPLMGKRLIPAYKKAWAGLFTIHGGNQMPHLRITEQGAAVLWGDPLPEDWAETVLFFVNTGTPEALESMSLRAFHDDEPGMPDVTAVTFEAIQTRLDVHRGRHLLTGTPFTWNAYKTMYHDRWLAGVDPKYLTFHRFRTWDNPSQDEARIRRKLETGMPEWRWRMNYLGEFTQAEGLVYDCWSQANEIEPFEIPADWPRLTGNDFGLRNAATVFAALAPNGDVIVYRTWTGGGDPAGIVPALRAGEPLGATWRHCGGAPSEDRLRQAYTEAGWPVRRPSDRSVDAGILNVYRLIRTGRLKIFRTLTRLITELQMYSYEMTASGELTGRIDRKQSFHRLDALRYLGDLVPRRSRDEESAEAPALVGLLGYEAVRRMREAERAADREWAKKGAATGTSVGGARLVRIGGVRKRVSARASRSV